MPNIKLYKQSGEQSGTVELADSVFGQDYNEALIHQVVVAQMANDRQGTKSTLTRSEVRGGGIKPWRQKGTGRARQGSIRAPQWIKGGVVFAPKPRDFSKKVNKQAKRIATLSALSAKVSADEVIVIDEIKLTAAKTREMAKILEAFKINSKVLLVVTDKDESVVRASGNLPNVTTINSDLINVYDIVAHAKFVATLDAMKKIEEAYKA